MAGDGRDYRLALPQTSLARRFAGVLLLTLGIIHLALAPGIHDEDHTLGWLFVAGGVICVLAGLTLQAISSALAFAAGAAMCFGMSIGFILSRTSELPDLEYRRHEDWSAIGLACLALELAFLVLTAIRFALGPGPGALVAAERASHAADLARTRTAT